jgi:hypothetical protein
LNQDSSIGSIEAAHGKYTVNPEIRGVFAKQEVVTDTIRTVKEESRDVQKSLFRLNTEIASQIGSDIDSQAQYI